VRAQQDRFQSMFVCPSCELRLTAVLQEKTPTAVRCECAKVFVVQLPPARKTSRGFQAPSHCNLGASSSEETDSHASDSCDSVKSSSHLSVRSVQSSVQSVQSVLVRRDVACPACASTSLTAPALLAHRSQDPSERSRPLPASRSTCSSASSAVNISLACLDPAEVVGALAASPRPPLAISSSGSPLPAIAQGEEGTGQADAGQTARSAGRGSAASQHEAVSSLLYFEFPALRALLGS
jgi:hypothetical protein